MNEEITADSTWLETPKAHLHALAEYYCQKIPEVKVVGIYHGTHYKKNYAIQCFLLDWLAEPQQEQAFRTQEGQAAFLQALRDHLMACVDRSANAGGYAQFFREARGLVTDRNLEGPLQAPSGKGLASS